MATGERCTTDGDATARWLGESGELVSRYGAAVGEHVGRMATVNADLRAELARERRRADTARALLEDVERRMIDAGQAAEDDEDEDWWGDTVEMVREARAALAGRAEKGSDHGD